MRTETTNRTDDRARTLIEAVMRNGASIAEEYPTVFGEGARGELIVLEEDGELRSACAIQPCDLAVGSTRVRVGLIGSVVTDPAHQCRGNGTRLLDLAEEALRDRGCAFALLWADERGFYARRGYSEIGCERDFIVSPELALELPEPEGCREFTTDDVETVREMALAGCTGDDGRSGRQHCPGSSRCDLRLSGADQRQHDDRPCR